MSCQQTRVTADRYRLNESTLSGLGAMSGNRPHCRYSLLRSLYQTGQLRPALEQACRQMTPARQVVPVLHHQVPFRQQQRAFGLWQYPDQRQKVQGMVSGHTRCLTVHAEVPIAVPAPLDGLWSRGGHRHHVQGLPISGKTAPANKDLLASELHHNYHSSN